MNDAAQSGRRLADYTTLRLGGPAEQICHCPDADSLQRTLLSLDAAGTPVLLIGGGSNLVIADTGFAGAAVILTGGDIAFDTDAAGNPTATAWAGTNWDELVERTVAAGFGGLEALSGIPGAAGTTPVQNVGAYGVEIADVLDSVQLFDRATGALTWVAPATLNFGYRTSALKYRGDRVVVAVRFRLTADGLSRPIGYRELARSLGVAEGGRAPAAAVRAQVLELRSGKGMVLDPADHDTWSAGSFFTNPIVADTDLPEILARIGDRLGDTPVPRFPAEVGHTKLSAGWLIERAGFGRGYPAADAPVRLSTKHTLALTNRGTARTADLLALAREVRDGVLAAFGVTLHPEPVFVGCEI